MGIMASERARLAVLAGSSSVYRHLAGGTQWVQAASVAWRTLTDDAERWFCELDWMVNGVGERYYHGSRRG